MRAYYDEDELDQTLEPWLQGENKEKAERIKGNYLKISK